MNHHSSSEPEGLDGSSNTSFCSTAETVQSGLYYGTLATVRFLAAAVTREHFANEPPFIVGTGGFGRLFEHELLFDGRDRPIGPILRHPGYRAISGRRRDARAFRQ